MKKILFTALTLTLLSSYSMAQGTQIGSSPIYYYNSGEVGIGTTTPGYKLDVAGNARFTSEVQVQSSIFLGQVNSSRISSGGNREFDINYGINGSFNYYSGTVNQFKIDFNGNVGIGTPSPSNKLTVRASNALQGLRVESSLGKVAYLGNLGSASNIDRGLLELYDQGSSLIRFAAESTSVSYINAGNVGIGTTSPGSKLEIKDGNFWMNSNTNVYSVIDRPSTDRRGGLVFTTNGNSTESLPSTGINWSMGMVDSDEGGDGSEFFIGNTTFASSAKFWLEANGNLGLGVANPSERLEVNGTIRSKKVKVEASVWPDYVFSSTYKLRTLNELEQFIQQNQHLPEVPSAEEIEVNGLDLGDMEATLLKKIEELTLYAIEQGKKLEISDARYQKLESENNELRAMLVDMKKEIESIKKQ